MLTWFELKILSWNLQLTLCSWNMQEYLSWLCPTTVLASESWLVLLVRIGGSELVTDSVSLFWKPKWKKGRKKLEEQGIAAETHQAINRQNLNSTRHSQQVQTQTKSSDKPGIQRWHWGHCLHWSGISSPRHPSPGGAVALLLRSLQDRHDYQHTFFHQD